MIKGEQYSVIDLFCGIGGFSKGFENLGFNILLGIDNWEIALKTFEKNHNHSICKKSITEIKPEEIPEVAGFQGQFNSKLLG